MSANCQTISISLSLVYLFGNLKLDENVMIPVKKLGRCSTSRGTDNNKSEQGDTASEHAEKWSK